MGLYAVRPIAGGKSYGSLTLASSVRVGPGSVFTGSTIVSGADQIKTFGFRGNLAGSWFIDGRLGRQHPFLTAYQGTFPGGQGSVRLASFEEAVGEVRARVRLSAAGSISVFYAANAQAGR